MNGKYYIDIFDYDDTMQEYLMNQGAFACGSYISGKLVRKKLQFEGCKPFHFNAGNETSCRLFFPNEAAAELFSFVFGNKISYSNVRSIKKAIDEIELGR